MGEASPTRPVVRWYGGKWLLAPWIIGHFPEHRVYVEPFGGGGSVLLRKPRSVAEIYSDLDGDVVALFRVLRNPQQAARLAELLYLTPFAREEFLDAYERAGDPVECARRMVVKSFMGFGSAVHQRPKTGFRSAMSGMGRTPAREWLNYPESLAAVVDRLRGVTIENRPACKVMAQYDSTETLHYLDPPYLHATRGRGNPHDVAYSGYHHEMFDDDHVKLLNFACDLKGMVVLSGYPHPMYDAALQAWRRVERPALAQGGSRRTEVLWINPAAVSRLDTSASLFSGVA